MYVNNKSRNISYALLKRDEQDEILRNTYVELYCHKKLIEIAQIFW